MTRTVPLLLSCIFAVVGPMAHADAGTSEQASGQTSERASEEKPGELRGRVTIDLEGTALSDVSPIVVYLEPLGGSGQTRTTPSRRLEINQKNAHFSPEFSVAVVGQTVDMKNLDAIYHNVFSYSRPNDFDLGTYPAGESRSVKFSYPGVVKTYCSIHENMNGTILVTPTVHYDIVGKTGRFSIRAIPPGTYRLSVWSEKLPQKSTKVTIQPAATAVVEIPLLGS